MLEEKFEAIYARQSVDKKDSVSIEGQIDACKKYCTTKNILIFSDKGYSGKNVERPQLQKLIQAIEKKMVSKVYVYKLDRISRNIVDFYNLYEIMRSNNCDIISINETFDSSNPMGRAMMGILAVFAQMERENISLRVKDNYDYRTQMGKWGSGNAPFGYVNTKVNGATEIIPVDDEINIVKFIYKTYSSEPNISIGKLQNLLIEKGVKPRRRENGFPRTSLRRILTNPFYVSADKHLHRYYERFGIEFVNDISEWDGSRTACIIGKHSRSIKSNDNTGMKIYLTHIKPIIESDEFIMVQNRLNENVAFRTSNKVNAFMEELTGFVKCEGCGSTISIQNKPTLSCVGRHRHKGCNLSYKGIRLESLQAKVGVEIEKRLFDLKQYRLRKTHEHTVLKAKIKQLEDNIDLLVKTMSYSKLSPEALARQLDKLQSELAKCRLKQDMILLNQTDIVETRLSIDSLLEIKGKYSDLPTEKKKAIIQIMVDKIILSTNGEIEIVWKK